MDQFRDKIKGFLVKETRLKYITLEIPPDTRMGDYAFPCFGLSKEMKKKPGEIAEELAGKFKPDEYISEAKVVGPYLNFFVDKAKLTEIVLKKVIKEKDDYGKGNKKKDRIMVEYSEPNPFKGFHIGHLRNTVLGLALVNLLRMYGYEVIPVNYYNDTGSHVSKVIWRIITHYKNKIPEDIDRGEWLGNVYSEASKIITEGSKEEEEYKEVQRKIENGDKKLNELRKKGIGWSEEHFNRIYGELGAKFERIFYDSELIAEGKKVVDELLKKGIAEKSEGAVIVNLEKYKLPTVVILRSDKTAVYITKDFELAKKKFKDYDIDRSIYVVGTEQINHFKQLFKILELYGFKQAKKSYHLAYELVNLAGGKKMSSRGGDVILYSELKNKIRNKIRHEVSRRHPEWDDERREVSEDGIFSAAIRFDMLKQEPRKVINFDVDKALDFEGETGPYIQYAHARICSIFRRYNKKIDYKIDFRLLDKDEEKNLVTLLSGFPKIVEESAEHYRVHLLCNYLQGLAQSFNEFYHICPILNAEPEIMKARLVLAYAARHVLRLGLNLLGIIAPKEM